MMKRKCQVLEEVTVWDKAHAKIPNHTYYIDAISKRMVAYKNAITGVRYVFSGKGLQFDRRFRKFKMRGWEYV